MIELPTDAEPVRIIQGDCLEVLRRLPDGCVDAIVTDPPYCSGGNLEAQKNTKAQGLRGATVAADDFEWFANDNMGTAGLVWMLRSVMIECRRLLKPNRSAFVFTDWRMVPNLAPALESAGMRYRNMIIWDKGSGGLGVGFKPSYEVILEFTNGVTEYASLTGQNVLRVPRVHSSEKEHNAQKPVALIREIISVATRHDEVILDPFAGSGTAAKAAVISGRRCIAIELSPKNVGISRRRVAEAMGTGLLAGVA